MLRRFARSLLCGLTLFAGALILGALMPRNAGAGGAGEGVPVFVRSNGVHTDIVMPVAALGLDWRRLVQVEAVPRPDLAGNWIAIGTGERETFLNTPRWRDIRLRTVAGALFGGELLIHVEFPDPSRPGRQVRALRLSPEQYRRLVASIAADFRRDERGKAVPLFGTGYGSRDVFYLARGRYDGLRNCNQWTADRLAGAGVRVGRWTPLASGVLASLR